VSKKAVARCGLFLLIFSLSGCFWFDENDTIQISDNYQVMTTSDGNNFLYFSGSEENVTESLLSGISLIGTTDTCLAVCKANHYYLFSLRQTTREAVVATRIGPLTKAAFRSRIYRMTGDSTLQLRSI
jgi:hypothetical protein